MVKLSTMIPSFKGEIETNIDAINHHSQDASAFKITPEAVLFPQDLDDIIKTLDFAKENKKSISVRAGGTCMTGGSLNHGLILNLTRHLHNIEIDKEKMTAKVEMGAMFRDIEAEAGKERLMFAPYTSSKDVCGIGGMIGNNASGEKSIRLGATIDNVLELEVILHDGSILKTKDIPISEIESGSADLPSTHISLYREMLSLYREYSEKLKIAQGNVSKIASGYRLDRVVNGNNINLTSLFIGAQGTLGIITSAVLKLTPIPTFTRLLLIPIDSLIELPYILHAVMDHNPEGVETFDIHTFHRSEKTMPEETNLISRFFAGSTSLLVLAQFSEETLEKTNERALACLSSLGAHATRAEYIEDEIIQNAAWKIRRSAFGVLRDHNEGSFQAIPCIEDIIVPIDEFSTFIPRLTNILDTYKIFYGYHGHIGDGSLRIIPIIDTAIDGAGDLIILLCREVFGLVKSLGGNMSTDHSDGIIRSPFLKEFYGEEIYKVFENIKKTFDPEGILNQNKKIGGTEDLLKKYLKK